MGKTVAQFKAMHYLRFIDNDSQKAYECGMKLLEAPFSRPLRIVSLRELKEEERLVLKNLGLDEGEQVEKRHVAPLGDPVGLLVGSHVFTLRRELCRLIEVEAK